MTVALSYFGGAGWQFFDNNGDPLSGGLIYTYDAGTTTPRETYTSSLGDAAHTNPIVLDAAGRVNEIWLSSGYQYKFVLKTALGVTIGTYDNLTSINDMQLDWANVTFYGAVGDGINDDTSAFAAAIATGRPVYVPSGTYKLTSGLTINSNGQRIFGDGENETYILPSGNFDVITLQGPTDHCGVERMTFNAIGMTDGYIVNVNGADRVYCAHIRINNPWNSFRVFQCNAATFYQIYGQRPRGPYAWYLYGETLGERSDVIRFQNVNYGGLSTERIWTGIYVDGTVNTLQVIGTTFVLPLRGFHVVNSGALPSPEFNIVHDLEVDFPALESVRLEAGLGFWFTSLYAQGSAGSAGFYIGPNANSVLISNAYIRGNNQEGIIVEGNDVSVSNAQVVFNGFPGAFYNFDCVKITGTANRVQFSNCQFGQTEGVGTVARYGIGIENGARSIRVSNCGFDGCALGDVLDDSGVTNPTNVEVTGSGAAEQFFNERVSGFVYGVASGSGATVSPTIVSGAITGVTALVGGSNYEVAPAVLAFDPTNAGSGFVATAAISNGAVTGITITNPGANYGAGTILALRSATTTPTIRSNWPTLPNIGVRLAADGTGSVLLTNARGIGFNATAADANSVNYLQARGRGTGLAPDIIAVGADANIDIGFIPKGAGRLRFSGPTAVTAGGISEYLEIQVGATVYKLPLYAV